jgi:LysR family transcriptional regulator, low CO2-responsive transcriptional regulator
MKSPLDSRQLHAFVILARTGSFTQTARELFLTQSAVSHSMKALETDIGCRLLDRLGKKVLLTQAGEHLLQHAERILLEMGSARAGIERLGKWGVGRLRIVAPATLCASLLPPVLREFKESFPQSLISIEPGDSFETVGILEDNRADLALTMLPKPDDRFEFLPLFTDELAFIASPLHPWAAAGSVPRAEIARQNLVIYAKKSLTWRLIDEYFREEKIVLNTVIELSSMEAIKELVKLNLGVGILAPWAAQKELRDGSLVALPLGRRKAKRDWGILHWRARRLTLAEETFIGLCRSASEGLTHWSGDAMAA